MRRLSLDWLSAREASPAALVRLAAAHRIDLVTLSLVPVSGMDFHDLVDDVAARDALVRLCDSEGVAIDSVEPFMLEPGVDIAGFARALAATVAIGARRVLIMTPRQTIAEAADCAARFCRLCATFGLAANLEFSPRMPQRDFDAAVAFVDAVGEPNLGLCVDSLHFFRSSSNLASLAAARGLIGRVQLSDGPAVVPDAGGLHEAWRERMVPGDGALPLRAFLAAVPEDVVLGLEVPVVPAFPAETTAQRVGRIVEGTRRFLRG